MATKKKKKTKIPEVPEAQMIDVGNLKEAEMKFEPLTGDEMAALYKQFMGAQQEWFPQMLANQVEAQSQLFRNMSALQREQAPAFAQRAWEMAGQYTPEFFRNYSELAGNLYNQIQVGVHPQFMAAYRGLGKRVAEGLAQGYELGPELAGEVEQGIRAAQTARGNYLGPALTAEEAFGKGQAALNLYNQRLGQAQNYLQGQQPTDVWAKITGQAQNFLQGRNPSDIMGQMAGTFMGQNYYPQSTYLDPGMGLQAANIQQQGQSSYNQTLNTALQDYNRSYIGAFNANNEAQYNNYDRNFEQYLYNQAVQHGLYSMPSVGGAGGGGMGIAGSAIGAVGAIGGGIIAAF